MRKPAAGLVKLAAPRPDRERQLGTGTSAHAVGTAPVVAVIPGSGPGRESITTTIATS
jgi:hypothetical protein